MVNHSLTIEVPTCSVSQVIEVPQYDNWSHDINISLIRTDSENNKRYFTIPSDCNVNIVYRNDKGELITPKGVVEIINNFRGQVVYHVDPVLLNSYGSKNVSLVLTRVNDDNRVETLLSLTFLVNVTKNNVKNVPDGYTIESWYNRYIMNWNSVFGSVIMNE